MCSFSIQKYSTFRFIKSFDPKLYTVSTKDTTNFRSESIKNFDPNLHKFFIQRLSFLPKYGIRWSKIIKSHNLEQCKVLVQSLNISDPHLCLFFKVKVSTSTLHLFFFLLSQVLKNIDSLLYKTSYQKLQCFDPKFQIFFFSRLTVYKVRI